MDINTLYNTKIDDLYNSLFPISGGTISGGTIAIQNVTGTIKATYDSDAIHFKSGNTTNCKINFPKITDRNNVFALTSDTHLSIMPTDWTFVRKFPAGVNEEDAPEFNQPSYDNGHWHVVDSEDNGRIEEQPTEVDPEATLLTFKSWDNVGEYIFDVSAIREIPYYILGNQTNKPVANPADISAHYLAFARGGVVSGPIGVYQNQLHIISGNYLQSNEADAKNYSSKNSFLQAENASTGDDMSTGSYGPSYTGSKGYCILSVIFANNTMALSGNIDAISAMLNNVYDGIPLSGHLELDASRTDEPFESLSERYENEIPVKSRPLTAIWGNRYQLSDVSFSFSLGKQQGVTDIRIVKVIDQIVNGDDYLCGIVSVATLPIELADVAIDSKNITAFTIEDYIYLYENDDNAIYVPGYPEIGNTVIENFYAQHAEGGSSRAIGKYSHTEGRDNVTDVRYSHAEGSHNFAGGMASHAEGFANVAFGRYSHADGEFTRALGRTSHASGLSAVAEDDYSFVWNGVSSTKTSNGIGTFNVYPRGGASNFYISGKSFTSYFNGTDSTTNTENHAHTEGYMTSAIGESSHAEGNGTIANQLAAHSEGGCTLAGTGSKPTASNETNDGQFAHAEGNGTFANGNSSHAEGKDTQALGMASHTEGYQTKAVSNGAHAEGGKTAAGDTTILGHDPENKLSTGYYTHAEGHGTLAKGFAAHAEGFATEATGKMSHSAGKYAKANQDYSWVWSGRASGTSPYTAISAGTFCIDPTNGPDGFFIGMSSLNSVIDNRLSRVDAFYLKCETDSNYYKVTLVKENGQVKLAVDQDPAD